MMAGAAAVAEAPRGSWTTQEGDYRGCLPMGDYDKIGRPSLQDGVGRLTRFSPRDDPVHCHPARPWPSSSHDRTAELLASPG